MLALAFILGAGAILFWAVAALFGRVLAWLVVGALRRVDRR